MTNLRKAAEMAVETLDNISESGVYFKENPFDAYMRLRNMAKGAMQPLQKALAQPEQANPIDTYERAYYEGKRAGIAESEAIKTQSEQEPVAWQFYQDGRWHDGMYLHNHRKNTEADGYPVRDLYTAPPKREWVGLTDGERVQAFVDAGLELAYMDYDADMKISKVIEAKLKEKNT